MQCEVVNGSYAIKKNHIMVKKKLLHLKGAWETLEQQGSTTNCGPIPFLYSLLEQEDGGKCWNPLGHEGKMQ